MLEELIRVLRGQYAGQIVSCPEYPIQIPGVSASTFTADDAFGLMFEVNVPKMGVIYSATFWDLDDEGTQFDFEIFRNKITQIASEAKWTPVVGDLAHFVTELAFFSFDDHDSCQTSELENIGKAYTAPEGKFWIQTVCRSTPDMASPAVVPLFQMQILSFDPDWR